MKSEVLAVGDNAKGFGFGDNAPKTSLLEPFYRASSNVAAGSTFWVSDVVKKPASSVEDAP